MDARQESQLNMQRTVEKLLDENTAITDTVLSVKNLAVKFKAFILMILKAVELQGKQTGGISEDKAEAKKTMCEMASEMAGFGMAYATEIDNDTLHEELNYSESDLMHLRDDEAGPICLGIHGTLATHKTPLADYGITDASLLELQNTIALYEAIVPDVRTAEVKRTAETEKIELYLKKNNLLLSDQLDRLMPLFKISHPDFVDLYRRARVLVDPKHFTTAMRVTVIDSVTDLEIPVPKLKIVETGVIIPGNDSGIILWKPATQGDFHFEVSADGYVTFTGSVHVTLGAETAIEVKLVRV